LIDCKEISQTEATKKMY